MAKMSKMTAKGSPVPGKKVVKAATGGTMTYANPGSGKGMRGAGKAPAAKPVPMPSYNGPLPSFQKRSVGAISGTPAPLAGGAGPRLMNKGGSVPGKKKGMK